MKHMMKFTVMTILAMGLASCSMFNVDVDSTFSGVLDINVQESMVKAAAEGFPFSSSTTLDPQDDPDVAKYADLIVDVGVHAVTAEVTYVSETDVVILSGTIFTISDDVHTASWPLEEDWPIEVGNSFTLADIGGTYADVADILMDAEEFDIAMSGNSSKSGVTISIEINLETTITGNPF